MRFKPTEVIFSFGYAVLLKLEAANGLRVELPEASPGVFVNCEFDTQKIGIDTFFVTSFFLVTSSEDIQPEPMLVATFSETIRLRDPSTLLFSNEILVPLEQGFVLKVCTVSKPEAVIFSFNCFGIFIT